MLRSRLRRSGVLFSVVLLLTTVSAASAAPQPGVWNGPEVYAGEKAGAVSIPVSDSTFTTIASLAVPVGRWVAFAKFEGRVPLGAANIVCDLIAGTGASQTRQRGFARVGMPQNDEQGGADLAFNLDHTFTNLAGTFRLRCRASNIGATAHSIRIAAMRVGTLTRRPLDLGAAATTGSGKPEVVHGFRNTPVSIPGSDTFSPIAAMPLSAGTWLIRADMSVVEPDVGVPVRFSCRLAAGSQTDALPGKFEIYRDSTMVDFNVVAAITPRRTLDDVRLTCSAEISGMEVRDIHITAIKLGTATQVLFTNNSATTTGSGKPVAIHGQRFLAPDLTSSFASLGTIGLGAGKWLVMAKASTLAGNSVACRLRDGADIDRAYEEFPDFGRTMVMQIASSTSTRHNVSIDCRDPHGPNQQEPDAGKVGYVKVTALRLATLTFRDL